MTDKILNYLKDLSTSEKPTFVSYESIPFTIGKKYFNMSEYGDKNKFSKQSFQNFRKLILDGISKLRNGTDEFSKEFQDSISNKDSPLAKLVAKIEHISARKLKMMAKAQSEDETNATQTPLFDDEEETEKTTFAPKIEEPKVEIVEEKPLPVPKKKNSIKTAKDMVGVLSSRVNSVGDQVEDVSQKTDIIAENQKQIADAGALIAAKITEPKKKGIKDLFDEAENSGKSFEDFLDDIDKSQYDVPLFDKPSILKKKFEDHQFANQMATLGRYGSIPDSILNQMVESGELSSDQLIRIQDAKNKLDTIRRREAVKDYIKLETPTIRRERKIRLIDHGFNPALLRRP